VQRHFSTFPDGWPGRGLLLLRLTVSVTLLNWAIHNKFADPNPIALVRDWLAAAGGLLMIAGLWIPIVGVLVALIELWIAVSGHPAPETHVLIAALAASMTMLGPGAWSVDARLFGRKVFKSGDRDV
jgi:putative oxidoreductase